MTVVSPWEFDARSDRLFIHFDVDDHFLRLDTFIATAESARKVIEALDATFFQGTLEYELIVLPPEDGSFLSKLALWVSGGVASVFAFMNSDVGSAYVEGLTGKPPAEWAQEIGRDHREQIQSNKEPAKPEGEETPGTSDSVEPRSVPEDEEAACRSGARIVVAMTRGMLEKSNDELTKIGMEIGDLPDALDARAEFYTACIEDRDVKRIGFSQEDDFPIPRNQFPERTQKPARKEKDDEPPEWTVTIESIYVTSPNWDEEDQKARQWKGKDSIRRDCYFVIEDAEFWRLVKRKDLHVEVLDNLKVQWAFQVADGRPKNRRVLRVLEFNGDKLAEPLAPDAIKALLGDFTTGETPRGQPSLFDDSGD
ncbi:hypothetical protein M8756_01900 [Lutimaribacter sp. EGI FJ00015]|uniref:Uncharacterized protein n=1 Tax=Lutimaribacter degradans TaxID=2945989 RepID=A0ACC5ZTA2_9RHOB|nr:hypothetical protein [Lutimaribacter sp. EGI FJ00013]MCM2561006.1 hypothetical protein [Lutimaribacter sp. EGI FJ00013]MCO0612047.1 hypothetical protein [Lutimaribacter sp. EGI FJ00015]MCO0634833.1 hypothetical protein [Lutimaribacter sp. EGI FJ00014]